jgi:hypothetical protein
MVHIALPTAAVALAKLTAKRRCTATLDCAQCPMLDGAKPMRGTKRLSMGPDDIGQLQLSGMRAPLRRHSALPARGLFQ